MNLYAGLLESNIASFAGKGNPFSVGAINPGDTVANVGSAGRVISFDMTQETLKKAQAGAAAMGATNNGRRSISPPANR